MITETIRIADVFDSLHDGAISLQGQTTDCTMLQVESPYVTEATGLVSEYLTLAIENLRDVEFRQWNSDQDENHHSIAGALEVFTLGLQILDARVVDDVIVVDCDVSGDNLPFSGGEFRFRADGLVILDDAGREMTLAEMIYAANRHWSEFGSQST